jgi:hypothetical protein
MKVQAYVLRALRYYWDRPKPPLYPGNFIHPVVVVGSAPASAMPCGFDGSYHVITINGSQTVTERWGRAKPDVTFMTGKQVLGWNANAVSVRSVVEGRSTGLLIVTIWPRPIEALAPALDHMDYQHDDLRVLTSMQRIALHHAVLGSLNLELSVEERFSNGLTGVLYALASGAPAVIISGIDPLSSGHVYNDRNLRRQHSDTDAQTLRALVKRGHPLYTADLHVGRALGIPLWQPSGG